MSTSSLPPSSEASSLPASASLAGVDVAKASLQLAVLAEGSDAVLYNGAFAYDAAGVDAVVARLKAHNASLVVIEGTGGKAPAGWSGRWWRRWPRRASSRW